MEEQHLESNEERQDPVRRDLWNIESKLFENGIMNL